MCKVRSPLFAQASFLTRNLNAIRSGCIQGTSIPRQQRRSSKSCSVGLRGRRVQRSRTGSRQNLRKHHRLPPEFAPPPQPAASTTHYRSPSAGPPLPSYLVENLVDTRPSGNDRPNRKRERLSSPGEGGSRDAGKQGRCSPRRSY